MSFENLFDLFLILLCIGTIFVQFHDTTIAVQSKRFDFLSILPYWTFFAPTPMVNDYRIFLVSRNVDEIDLDEWDELVFVSERKWFHFIWHPSKKKSKAVVDIVQYLTVHTQHLSSDQIVLSISYLNLSQFVESYICENQMKRDKAGFQYLIAKDLGYQSHLNDIPEIIFRSAYHRYS
jgi:hypothetical protein